MREVIPTVTKDARPLAPGTLFALMGGSHSHEVRRIVRVVQDLGDQVIVENDSVLEGEASVEYDTETPPPASLVVNPSLLRLIKE